MTYKEIVDYVKNWLNDNVDEAPPEGAQEDAANLLQKINEMEAEV